MLLSASAQKIITMIKEALNKNYITMPQYEAIIAVAYEDGYLDRQEQAALSQLKEIIESRAICFIPQEYGCN